ncbi:hypothetical protein [Halosolutus halophilus]|uniref:hypothetical protein n=1 Tax=Halosolutus halophilus TaxID=1552990 RepID=UPI0022351744|nr:hypothetical protein [Halosolutus halophilus]
MSQATSPTNFEQLSDQIKAGIERLFRETDGDGSDETLSSTAKELWDVVEEVEDLLDTIDLERLPDVVEVSALPDLVNLEELPNAIREKDPDLALDFSTIRHAIKLRELWNTVDLVDFQRELRQLKAEVEDVVGPDALGSSGDSRAAAEIRKFGEEEKGNATNAAIQQEVKEGAKTARKGVIEGHSKFEDLYESTQRGPGYLGRKPISKNPTAVSTLPYGPLPASVSTRVSTVPQSVRQARVDALPRIYAHRWRRGAPTK